MMANINPIQKVVIVGAGLMGSGIAQVLKDISSV
jgi:3-hydroxyacyl-CoA dehydrogenase